MSFSVIVPGSYTSKWSRQVRDSPQYLTVLQQGRPEIAQQPHRTTFAKLSFSLRNTPTGVEQGPHYEELPWFWSHKYQGGT